MSNIRRRRRFVVRAIGTAAVAVAIGACSPGSPSRPPSAAESPGTAAATPQPVDRKALTAVSLPDLSAATKATAQQLRDQYAMLERQIEDPVTTTGDLAMGYGAMGKLLLAAEYLDAAELCFLDAQALMPAEMRWPYYLGHLYRLRGETDKSATSFERARQLRPDDEATVVWLGTTYLDQGRPEAAEPMFDHARSIAPGSGAALFGLGRAALAKHDYVRAVDYLEQTLAVNRQASIVHYPLATAYRRLGRLQEAETHLRAKGDVEVALSDPLMDDLAGSLRSEFAYEHLGVRALDSGDFEGAAGYFRQALALAPEDVSLRHRLGTALALHGDIRGATAEFREVLRRAPGRASTRYALGVLMASSGRDRDAIEQFSAAVESTPEYMEARLQLADALRRTGRLQESLLEYERVISLDPRVADGPLGYAMALVGLGRYREARDRLSAGMKVYPDRPQFAHGVVRLLAAAPDDRVRDGRQAVVLAEDRVAVEQPNADLGEAMAMALAEAGRYEDAVTWQRQAMTIAEQTGRADLSKRMVDNLALFEQHRPSRQPWRENGPTGPADAAVFRPPVSGAGRP